MTSISGFNSDGENVEPENEQIPISAARLWGKNRFLNPVECLFSAPRVAVKKQKAFWVTMG